MATLVDISAAAAIESKQAKLLDLLRAMRRVIVAYSGGTDSAYLAWAAKQALGNEVRRDYGGFSFDSGIAQTRC